MGDHQTRLLQTGNHGLPASEQDKTRVRGERFTSERQREREQLATDLLLLVLHSRSKIKRRSKEHPPRVASLFNRPRMHNGEDKIAEFALTFA